MAEAPNSGAPNGGGDGNNGGPAPAWHGITDPTEAAYVTNKGWNSPADVIKSYQGAEKLIGQDPSQLVRLPRSDDAAGFRTVMQKLGLPESADKYDFGKPGQGDLPWDDGYVNWAKGAFHKAGVPADMAKQLMAEHNAYVKSVTEQQSKDYQLSVQTDKQALLKEWGGGHERMMNIAQTAAKALGFTAEMVDAIEQSVGYAGAMKFFVDLGKKMGEDSFVSGGGGPKNFGDVLTPNEAKVQWEAMKLDPQVVAALKDNQHPAHKSTKDKQTRLFAIMFPEGK